MFLFSPGNNIIVETTVNKIYIKNNSYTLHRYGNVTSYKEADLDEAKISSLQYGKIVYVKNDDFDEMIIGVSSGKNKIISSLIKVGYKKTLLNKIKYKIRKLMRK